MRLAQLVAIEQRENLRDRLRIAREGELSRVDLSQLHWPTMIYDGPTWLVNEDYTEH